MYLDGWADDRGQVARVDAASFVGSVINTKDASVIKDFYTILGNNGQPSDAVEDFFADEIEGKASPVLAKLRTGDGAKPPDKHAIASWVALHHLRSESFRDSISGNRGEMFRWLISFYGFEGLRAVMSRTLGRDVTDSEVEVEWEYLRNTPYASLELTNEHHVGSIATHLQPLTERLLREPWHMLDAKGTRLITSDTPVWMTDDHAAPMLGTGYMTAPGFVFPVSPERLIVVGAPAEFGLPTDDLCHLLNLHLSLTCRRAAFSATMDAQVAQAALRAANYVAASHPLLTDSQAFRGREGMYGEMAINKGFSVDPAVYSAPRSAPDQLALSDFDWPPPSRRVAYEQP